MPLVSLGLTIIGFLFQACGPLVARVLLSLGIGYVTYKGANLSVNWIMSAIQSATGSLPGQVAGLLGYLWVDKAIAMLFAAFTASLAVKQINGSFSRMVVGGGK